MINYLTKLGAIVLYLACSGVFAADLKLVASPWPPYVGQRLHNNGVAMHLVTEGLRRAGYKSVVNIETWPQDLEGVKQGSYDVIASIWHSKEREEFLAFSEPYIINSTHFIKRRDTPHTFKILSDLAGLKVGVIEGYAYGESFYVASDFKKVSQVTTVLDNLRGLLAGDLDLVLADIRVAFYELNAHIPAGIKKISVLDIPYSTKELRIGVSKRHPRHKKIIENFNTAIAAMKEDGSYAEIIASHRISID